MREAAQQENVKQTTADLILRPGTYVPKTSTLYPQQPDVHLIPVKHEIDFHIDEHYPYLDTSLKFRFWNNLTYLGIFTLVFWLNPLRFGLKIRGRENLKKYRYSLQNGAVTVANHVYRWDFLAVLQAVRWRKLWFPAWKDNFEGSDRNLIRNVGGIPLPDGHHAMAACNKAFDTLNAQKKWIHVFPESSRWDFYVPIRPFKRGAFVFAQKYNIPVIPIALSYRERTGIYKLFSKNAPLITVTIGTPLFPNPILSRRDCIKDLLERTHKAVCDLAGITQNPWPSEMD